MKPTIELAKEIFENTTRLGFYDPEIWELKNSIALIGSEAYEAWNAYRNNKFANLLDYDAFLGILPSPTDPKRLFEIRVKNTFEDELADVYIATLGLTYKLGLTDYDKNYSATMTHEFKDGMKDITDYVGHIGGIVSVLIDNNDKPKFRQSVFNLILELTETIADIYKVDLDKFVQLKVMYNKTRPKRHNKRF